MTSGPIGVFDSGIGGLTVARAIVSALPDVDLVYLGDTARLPYGAKSPLTVTRYASRCVGFLAAAGVEAVVVACNTASALALPALREAFPDLPILGVVSPGARAAVTASRTGRIGVIGTEATVRSHSYREAIHALAPTAEVVELPCPLLVPLAEVGWIDHPVTRLTLETYLAPLVRDHAIDALVLGCTHYPVLEGPIAAVLAALVPDRRIALVDSADAVTRELQALGLSLSLGGRRRFAVTDLPDRFRSMAEAFFGGGGIALEVVDL